MRYLQSDKKVKTNISFTEIDSTKKTIPKAMEEVLFNKHTLSGKKVDNQYRYQFTKTIPFVEDYTLTYRINKEETVTQDINIHPIINFSIKKGKVSKRVGTNFIFEGIPLATNETAVLLLSDEHGKTATIKIERQPENSALMILPEQVSQLATGKGMMYVVRKQTIKTQSVATQLIGLTEYYSAVKEIEIIE